VKPIIVLSKTDLIDANKLEEIVAQIKLRIADVPILSMSNETLQGFELIKSIIEKGKTYCLLGSSGVGKSTLMNNLSGKEFMKTGEVSESTNKGKHVTSHRELMVLEEGGILIDNPGMREVGIADEGAGLETTFDKILDLSKQCKFKDCSHTIELGCRIIEGLEQGEIDKSSYQNYLKMEREKAHFETSLADKRKKDKHFGKMMKNYKKDVNRKN
jgi:ribosome biogenesis GTPase